MLIAKQVSAGAGTVIAGFTAIFSTLGIGGGALRANLREAAWYGPLTALSASLRTSSSDGADAADRNLTKDGIGPSDQTDAAATDTSSLTLQQVRRTLDRVEKVARRRDTTLVPDVAATRRAFGHASLRSVLTWRSQTLRLALRSALGVLLTFLLAWATVGSADPVVTSMATASFVSLQISWTQSLFKAKQRLLGVTGGSALMALALWLLPQPWLLPFALLAAFAGLWFIASNQVLSISCFVVVSVGMNVVGRGLDPARTLLECVLLPPPWSGRPSSPRPRPRARRQRDLRPREAGAVGQSHCRSARAPLIP